MYKKIMKQNIFRFLDLAPSGPQLFHLDDAEGYNSSRRKEFTEFDAESSHQTPCL